MSRSALSIRLSASWRTRSLKSQVRNLIELCRSMVAELIGNFCVQQVAFTDKVFDMTMSNTQRTSVAELHQGAGEAIGISRWLMQLAFNRGCQWTGDENLAALCDLLGLLLLPDDHVATKAARDVGFLFFQK